MRVRVTNTSRDSRVAAASDLQFASESLKLPASQPQVRAQLLVRHPFSAS